MNKITTKPRNRSNFRNGLLMTTLMLGAAKSEAFTITENNLDVVTMREVVVPLVANCNINTLKFTPFSSAPTLYSCTIPLSAASGIAINALYDSWERTYPANHGFTFNGASVSILLIPQNNTPYRLSVWVEGANLNADRAAKAIEAYAEANGPNVYVSFLHTAKRRALAPK